jgi:hypothetical protein
VTANGVSSRGKASWKCARGSIVAKDRQGVEREFPLLSVAIGICHNRERALKNFAQVAALGAELKKAAKSKTGSTYVVDRRREDETSR